MSKSTITKHYITMSLLFFWLGVLLSFLPLIIFGIKGCLDSSIDLTNKLKLGLCFTAALFFVVYGIKSKYNCRSITYLLLGGCYFVAHRIEVVIIVCAICCLLDEFVCVPLHKYYHSKANINKEIDKRLNVGEE